MDDSLTKEQILEKLQDLVLTLVRKGKELTTNNALFKKWSSISKQVVQESKNLNKLDASWLSDNYTQWFKSNEEVQNKIKSYPKDFFPSM